MASAAIGSVYANLGINSAEFVMGLKKAQGQLSAFGTSLKAFAGSAAIGALTSLGLAAVRSGAQIGDLAETIGVTAEQIQVYNRLAVASGTSADVMAKGLQSIAEQSVDANSKLSKLFTANGFNAQAMTANEAIRTFMELIKNAKNPVEQLNAITTVLGDRVGRELVEAMREGARGYDQAQKDMIASGSLMSETEIRRLQELETEYNKVADQIAAYWMKTVVGASNIGTGFMDFRESVQKLIYGKTDADFAPRTSGAGSMGGPNEYASAPIKVEVTRLPDDDKPGGGDGGGGGGGGKTRPWWESPGYTSENPMQAGMVTLADLRGPALELTTQFEDASNMAADLAGTIVDTLGTALTGLVTGTESVKGAFANMAQSLVSDLGDLTSALLRAGLLGLVQGYGPSVFGGAGLFGSGFGGFRAAGGPVSAGRSYVVGENGPELFTPTAGGHITPNGGTTVNVINQGGGSVEQRKRRDGSGREIVDIIVGVTRQEQARGSKRLLGAGYGVNPALVQR